MENLYGITGDVLALYDACSASADEDTGEVDISLVEALAERQEAWEKKAVEVACVCRALDEDAERVAREIARLTAIKKRLETNRDRVKKGLSDACAALGVESLKGMYANISFRKSEQVVPDFEGAEETIPDEFMRVKVVREMDKVKIKAAIKEGRTVPGAHIEVRKNIQIR